MYRDFSNASKDRLLRFVNEVENDKWLGATDMLGDIGLHLVSLAIKLRVKNHLDDISNYHKLILDKSNTTKRKIYEIFEDVRHLDFKYQSNFTMVVQMLQSISLIMNVLNNTMKCSGGCVLSEETKCLLDSNFLNIEEAYFAMQKFAYEELGLDYVVTSDDIPDDKVKEKKNISISEFNPFMGLTKTMMEIDDGADALVSSPVLFDATSFLIAWMGNSQSVTQLQVTTSVDGNMTIEYGTPIENKYSGKHVSLNSIIVDKFYNYDPIIVFEADDKADQWIRSWFGLEGAGKYAMDCEFGNVYVGEFGYKLVFENGELYQIPIIHEGTKLNIYYKENGESKWLFDAANILRNTKIKLPDEEAEKVLEQLRNNGYIN